MIGYKVLSANENHFRSALNMGKTTEYELSQYVETAEGCGPFAVFETQIDALCFLIHNVEDISDDAVIFQIEYEQSQHHKLWCCATGDLGPAVRDAGLPPGTKFASKVMLLREVYRLPKGDLPALPLIVFGGHRSEE